MSGASYTAPVVDPAAQKPNRVEMPARPTRVLLRCAYWACFLMLAAVALAVQPMGWPRWVADSAVSAAFTLSGPSILRRLTAGGSAAWFARLRHRHWWTSIYLAACIAILAPRLPWPSAIPFLFGALALAGSAWLLIARRPLLIPKAR